MRPIHGFRRASLTVFAGSGTGHLIGLALTPVIARIYSPSVFGLFASLLAASTTLVGISTFRLEVLAQTPQGDPEARSIFRLALASNLAWGLAVSIGALVVAAIAGEVLWFAAGILIMVASLQLVGSGVLTRGGEYRRLAGANFVQGAGTGSIQVAFGALSPTPGSLVAGFLLGRLIWLRPILAFVPGEREALDRSTVRRFAVTAGPSALVNSLGGQAPILLASLLFSASGAGLLAMAVRLLVSPLSVVGKAAASASIGEVGSCIREGVGSADRIVRRATKDLFLLGLGPCTLAVILGRWLIPYILGPDWAATGNLVALLAVGTLAQVTVSPFAQLLNLLGRSRLLLKWDLARLILIVAAWLIPASLGHTLEVAVGVYSLALVGIYAALWWLLRSELRRT